MTVKELLEVALKYKASDLHLRVGSPPIVRIDGNLYPVEGLTALSPADVATLFEEIATPEKKASFAAHHELDFAFSIPKLTRCRVNILQQRSTLSIAIRLIPFTVPTIADLNLPSICRDLVRKPRGLILITGPTGSGKSSTIAAMIDYLNETRACNVITIEDPIEFVFSNKKSIIAQRDLGEDTESFDTALVHALRHDPDVIVVGEIREITTMLTALRAAETGHLILGTLHTGDASETINRVIDMFPSDQHDQIRSQLSQSLLAVLSQTLLIRAKGGGRVPAFEIMLANNAVKNLIREGRTHQLYNTIQVSRKEGMQTLNQALADVIKQGLVDRDTASLYSSNLEELNNLLSSSYY